MKLTYLDKLVLHMALMEYLERRIGDPAQPDEQLADAAVDYVNRRYGNHDENFKDMKNAAVYLNCVRAKAILRTLSEGASEARSRARSRARSTNRVNWSNPHDPTHPRRPHAEGRAVEQQPSLDPEHVRATETRAGAHATRRGPGPACVEHQVWPYASASASLHPHSHVPEQQLGSFLHKLGGPMC